MGRSGRATSKEIAMKRSLQIRALRIHAVFAFGLVLGLSLRASADPPPATGDKPVRQVGGAHGTKVESVQAVPEPNAASAHEMMQQTREHAREAMKEAREAMQKAPEETRAAVQEARTAMKEAQQD